MSSKDEVDAVIMFMLKKKKTYMRWSKLTEHMKSKTPWLSDLLKVGFTCGQGVGPTVIVVPAWLDIKIARNIRAERIQIGPRGNRPRKRELAQDERSPEVF